MYVPHEPGYLIPAIPFVILLFGRFLKRRYFISMCIGLLLSPFFFSLTSQSFVDIHGSPRFSSASIRFNLLDHQLVLDPLDGPIFSNHSRRIEGMKFTEQVLYASSNVPEKSVIVTGSWLTKVRGSLSEGPRHLVEYVDRLDAIQLQQFLDRGFKVYYLPGQREYNLRLYDVDLADYGATLLAPD